MVPVGRKDFAEGMGYVHRKPVRRGLVERPEDWGWVQFPALRNRECREGEIESGWTACVRGWQLLVWMRSPSPVPKGEGPGAPSTQRDSL